MTASLLSAEAIAALRYEFDSSFRDLPRVQSGADTDYLLVQTGNRRYAVALREVAMIQARCRITRVPGSLPGLLGVSSVRGELLAVYDLGVRIGHAESKECHWVLRVAGSHVAFAFEQLVRHVRIAREQGAAAAPSITLEDGECVPVISVSELAKAIVPQT